MGFNRHRLLRMGVDDSQTTRRRVIFEPVSESELVLRLVSSPDQEAIGTARPIEDSPLVIGRSCDEGWKLADATLSRRHFSVQTERDAPQLTDLGATNPTLVDCQPVRAQTTLAAGTVVMAGESVFVVEQRGSDDGLLVAHDVDGQRAAALRGISWAAERLRRALETAATSEGPVLLLGPTGSGKEVSAQIIHELSERAGAFVPINCAAIPGELAESLLFGHAKGAFTGADRARKGAFVEANGGTLFLDELGELSPAVQSKLLRVVQDGVVHPVGGEGRSVDVRIVAATLRSVEQDDGFREDLYARLAHWVVRIPPLSERRADVLPLFRHFVGGMETTADFDAGLVSWDWPGNVRELEKLAARLQRLARPGQPLDKRDLPTELRSRFASPKIENAPTAPRPNPASERLPSQGGPPSRSVLVATLKEHAGNINRVARSNGWHRMQVYRWMQSYGLDPSAFRD